MPFQYIDMNPHLIEVRHLSFNRGTHCVFNDVDIDIVRGKITAIMGPSGSGKTTLLRLIGRQLVADKGAIHLGGKDILTLNRKELFEVRRKIGMLFQSGALFTDLTIYENVAFPLRVHTKLSETMIHDLVLMKLQAVGLRGACDLMPRELSGGMARRVALARAVVLDPELIMYDEPFTGQDPISKGILAQLIRSLNSALNLTSIVVSHDVQLTANIADYIYVIADAKVIAHGTPDDVMNSNDARVRQFIHGLADGPVPFNYPAPNYSQDLQLEPVVKFAQESVSC